MAEIKIEKKSSPWPWIIAGIIILGILYYFVFMQRDATNKPVDDRDTVSRVETNRVETNNSAVYAFTSFVDDDAQQMDVDHHFSNSGLIKLCDASQQIADSTGHDVKMELDEARSHANEITEDATDTTHAEHIKKSAVIISKVLKNIQEDSFPGLGAEADQVKTTAEEISADQLTLDQKGSIKSFFNSASALVKKM